ncbi:MAG: translation initiation factor IF-2 associated domain-containing protein, partial [Proteobacteria bacterium]|nr:translation initiation factor IF-2 associated domain-containing protein [Pseudomonadota bacterium]
MTESKDISDGKLTLSGSKTLQLKRSVDAGRVRQSLSHGRGKSVVVEHKRRRIVARDTDVKPDEQQVVAPSVVETDSHLTDDERAVRVRVLEQAQKQAEIDKVKAAKQALLDAEATKLAAKVAKAAEGETAAEASKIEAEAPVAESEVEAETSVAAEPVAPVDVPVPPKPDAKPLVSRARMKEDDDDGGGRKAKAVDRPRQRLAATTRSEPRRRERPLTIQRALDDEAGERQRSLAAMRRARERQKGAESGDVQEPKKIVREIVVPETITVAELANRMAQRAHLVMRELKKM